MRALGLASKRRSVAVYRVRSLLSWVPAISKLLRLSLLHEYGTRHDVNVLFAGIHGAMLLEDLSRHREPELR